MTTQRSWRELPAAVEVAAYRIASEALTNAVRHAGARRCDITLTADEALTVEVTDDGRGLPDDPIPGIGLSSMRERAEELGGSFTATPPAHWGYPESGSPSHWRRHEPAPR